jgi:hypothetical protein
MGPLKSFTAAEVTPYAANLAAAAADSGAAGVLSLVTEAIGRSDGVGTLAAPAVAARPTRDLVRDWRFCIIEAQMKRLNMKFDIA